MKSGPNRARRATTPGELMRELENDPLYRARVAVRDAQVAAEKESFRIAEAPIVEDLRAAGFTVASVWDLLDPTVPHDDALPILVKHLESARYPDRVLELLGRALAVKSARAYWDRLLAFYRIAYGRGAREGVAVAIAACARPEDVDDLVALLGDDWRGVSRVHLLSPVWKLGGARGRALVRSYSDHPELGKEASAMTRRLRKD